MKRMMFLVLAILMILPVVVSCGSAPEGNPVAVSNVTVVSYQDAYAEDGTRGEGVEIYNGLVTAYVPEGETMTLKHVVEGYVYDNDVDAVLNDAGTMYESLAGYANGDGFFWNYYVNGKEVSLSQAVKETDVIELVFEK